MIINHPLEYFVFSQPSNSIYVYDVKDHPRRPSDGYESRPGIPGSIIQKVTVEVINYKE